MKKIYEDLYVACHNLDNFSNSAHFVPMKGKKYSGNEKKLLIIGRATNGWGSLDCSSASVFGNAAAEEFESDTRFDWIEDINGALYSTHWKYNKDESEIPKKDRYRVSRSPFWSYSKNIWQILNPRLEASGVWMENVAWSNLYVVGPNPEGNPTQEYCDAQLPACRQILLREVEVLNPTYVLLMTGYNWFKDFESCFSNVQKKSSNSINEFKFVEATADIGNARAVVMCRPEYKKKQQYVSEAVQALTHTSFTF